MVDYSELSTGQLYDLLFESISNQLNGIECSDKVKSIKEVADTRDISLYKNAFDKAISTYSPKAIVDNVNNKYPRQIEVIKDSLKDSNYKIAQVAGNSMVNKGIAEDDYVMYDQNVTIRNSDIIIAKYKEQIFIKSFYKVDGMITLKSNNPEFSDIVIENINEFEIFGKVIMLLKDI